MYSVLLFMIAIYIRYSIDNIVLIDLNQKISYNYLISIKLGNLVYRVLIMIEKLIELNNWFLALEATNPQVANFIIKMPVLLLFIIVMVAIVIIAIVVVIVVIVVRQFIKKKQAQIFLTVILPILYMIVMYRIVGGIIEIVALYFPTLSKTFKETVKIMSSIVISIPLLALVAIKDPFDEYRIKMYTDTEKDLKISFVGYGICLQILLYIILFIGIPLVLSIATVHAPIGNSKVKEIMSTFVEYLGIIILPVSLFLWARWESKKREDIQESEKEYRNLDTFVKEKIIPQLDKLEDENDYSKKYKILNSIWLKLNSYKPTSKVSKKIELYDTVIQNILDVYENRTDSILDRIIEDTRNIADITETNRSLGLYLGALEEYVKEEKERQLKLTEQEQKKDN